MKKVITRFAPSPTGHLHIGGARTALFCWLLARHFGGECRLRIEDTDTERSKQEYTDSILASMRWLGLDWDGDLIYQSQRADLYNAAVDAMLESGHAYWCSCSPEDVEAMREEARAKGEKPRYDGRCRHRKLGPAPGSVVRLNTAAVLPEGHVVFDDMVKGRIAVDVDELDDMILRRSDGMPTYNMAVVVDDHDMEISHVLRGDDHVSNTPKQILLYRALGWELPVFGHVPMILGPDRQKLSKRHGARAVVEYQQEGLLPHALVNCLARLGWSHGDQELFTMQELIDHFDGENLNVSASCFDFEKLDWLNAHYLRETPPDVLAALVLPFVQALNPALDAARIAPLVPLFRERAVNLVQLAEALTALLCAPEAMVFDPKAVARALNDEGRAHLRALCDLFAALPVFDAPALEAALNGYVESNGLKFKQVGPPLRAGLMGNLSGPHLPDLMAALGRETSLARMEKSLSSSEKKESQ